MVYWSSQTGDNLTLRESKISPIMMTVQVGSVMRPSHSDMNCVFIMAVASWSCCVRVRRNDSISSVETYTDYLKLS